MLPKSKPQPRNKLLKTRHGKPQKKQQLLKVVMVMVMVMVVRVRVRVLAKELMVAMTRRLRPRLL